MFSLDEEKTMVTEMDVRALTMIQINGDIEDLEATVMITKEDGTQRCFFIKDTSTWTEPECSGKLNKLGEEKSEMEESHKNQT